MIWLLGVARDLSPGLGIIRSTPPVQQPKARKRKRKQLFDESTVLTNKYGWFHNPLSFSSGASLLI